LERLGTLTAGVVRGERPAREEMKAVPKPKDTAPDYRPDAQPKYGAAFILSGDPEGRRRSSRLVLARFGGEVDAVIHLRQRQLDIDFAERDHGRQPLVR
jgi:hypothetical protein